MSDTDIAIGATVWIQDFNRRVYRDGQSGPIFREYFRPLLIQGETRVSWILEDGRKVNKKSLQGVFLNKAAIDDCCWVHDYVYQIKQAVGSCQDASVLRQIAALVKWEPKS